MIKVTKLKKLVNDQQEQIKDADKYAAVNKLVNLLAKAGAEPGSVELDGAFARWRRDGPMYAANTAHLRRVPIAARAAGAGGMPLSASKASEAGRPVQHSFVGTSLVRHSGSDDPEIVGRLEDALQMLATKASVLSERSNRLHSSTLPSHGYARAAGAPLSASLPLPTHVESALQRASAPTHASAHPAPRPANAHAADALTRMSEQEVGEWLRAAGLGEYVSAFAHAGFSGSSLAYVHTLASSSPATFFERMEALGMKTGHAARLANGLRDALG